MVEKRPVRMGYRESTNAPGHRLMQIFVGRNEGARGQSGVLIVDEDEWDEVSAALRRGGFDEMPSIATWPPRE